MVAIAASFSFSGDGNGILFYLSRPNRKVSVRAVSLPEAGFDRAQLLKKVDQELGKGNDTAALALVKEFQGKPGGLRCFGAARQVYSRSRRSNGEKLNLGVEQVPQRLYTLDELKLNGIDTLSLLSPVDTTLGAIERNLQLAAALGGVSACVGLGLNQLQILALSLGLLSMWSVDLIAFGGGFGSLLLDSIGHAVSQKYHNRVIQHEAGHFLIAYLLGILPRGYTLTSFEALSKEGSLNVQAGTAFVDYEYLEEINSGKLSAKLLDRFSCIALAGVASEYILFGYAEGGLSDIQKLDGLLKSLGFTQKKADSQVRWAVLNTILILRRHEKTRSKLAEAMSSGKSVGWCIETIEETIDMDDV